MSNLRASSFVLALLPIAACVEPLATEDDAPSDTSTVTSALSSDPQPAPLGHLPPTPPARVQPPPGVVGPTREVTNCDGRRERFRVSASNAIEHSWQLSRNGAFSGWESLGGGFLYGDLAVFVNGDCRVEVFGTGLNHEVFTRWQ